MIAGLTQPAAMVRRHRMTLLDAVVVVLIAAVIELLVWTGAGPGDPITGPRPVTAALPLLLAVPLLWRRRYPLTVCVLVISGALVQALASGRAVEGLYLVVAAGLVSYSVAAYSPRPRAIAGLVVVTVGNAIWTSQDPNVRSGDAGNLWAASFFALYLLALWLLGAVLQSRREARATAARVAEVEQEARRAVAAERSRIARELHDIVSHNLSVVVLQAAGGQAATGRPGTDVGATLAKIEDSGREALAEMRRLLGVLRMQDPADGGDADDGGDLEPVPGVAQVPALVARVQDGGTQARLLMDEEVASVSSGVGLSVYRIVQEALTNVVKHAGQGAGAVVTIARDGDDVLVTVVDDGQGQMASSAGTSTGHGLRGMRERAALLGGEFSAGPRPEGGFAVTARLPLRESP